MAAPQDDASTLKQCGAQVSLEITQHAAPLASLTGPYKQQQSRRGIPASCLAATGHGHITPGGPPALTPKIEV